MRDAALTPEAVAKLALGAAAAVDAAALKTLLRDLVRIRSVVEPAGGEAEVVKFLFGKLEGMGLRPVLEEVRPGRPNLICDWSGADYDPSQHKTLMLEGHSDVVTEGDPGSWTHPPFEGHVEGDRLYGRGSADMKAGVAAAVCALAALRDSLPELPGRIRLGVVIDEEGMMLGIKSFIERGWARELDGAIICEPEENELCLSQKGALRVGVNVRGRMAHGAMPYAGLNPIPALGSFLKAVSDWEREAQSEHDDHPDLGLPWMTPTIVRAPIEGEQQLNVMPETAYLALDVRTVPGQDHRQLWQKLAQMSEAVEAEHEGVEITLDRIEERPWTQTDPEDPLVKALESAYPGVMHAAPKYGGVPGATDGTFLHAWADVPIVTVGPGDRTIPHQSDEWVSLDASVKAARLYAAAAVHFFYDRS